MLDKRPLTIKILYTALHCNLMTNQTEKGVAPESVFLRANTCSPGPVPPRKMIVGSGSADTCLTAASNGQRRHPLAPLLSEELQTAGWVFILVTQASEMIPAAQGGPNSAENRTYTMGIGTSCSHLEPGRRGWRSSCTLTHQELNRS